jgi:tetratricopeptide (TPR) repeat protein
MRVGAYELLEELGRGGMGVVHRARSPKGAVVAVKLLVTLGPEELLRFERERRLLTSLGAREGFVPLVDAGRDESGRPFLVMPFLEGGTLEAKLGNPWPVAAARELGVALARAVGNAHRLGIVHRDLKPRNVLLDREGRPFVADLGLARHRSATRNLPGTESVEITERGQLLGTPGYMAPEQAEEAEAGPAADVFAVGVILHEALTGKKPWEGKTTLEYLALIHRGGDPSPGGRPAGVDERTWSVLRRALTRDPEARFKDGDELAVALALTGVKATPPRRRSALLAAALLLVLAVPLAVAGERLVQRERAASWAARAAARLAKKDLAGAIDDASHAIALDASLVQAWVTRAVAQERQGDLGGARSDLDRALALDDRCAEAWWRSGNLRLKMDDFAGATADATRAIELAPGIAAAWGVRGSAQLDASHMDRSISDLERAVALDPRDATAWGNLARARNRVKDLDGAIVAATRAIELDPSSGVVWRNRSCARLYGHGDVEGAIADATRAIELDPGDAAAWAARGTEDVVAKDFARAIADATRAIDIEPTLSGAWNTRGVARTQTGDPAGGIADCTRAIELQPRYADAWLRRGQARQGAGDWAGAIPDFEKFLELAPEDPIAPALRTWLAEQGSRH